MISKPPAVHIRTLISGLFLVAVIVIGADPLRSHARLGTMVVAADVAGVHSGDEAAGPRKPMDSECSSPKKSNWNDVFKYASYFFGFLVALSALFMDGAIGKNVSHVTVRGWIIIAVIALATSATVASDKIAAGDDKTRDDRLSECLRSLAAAQLEARTATEQLRKKQEFANAQAVKLATLQDEILHRSIVLQNGETAALKKADALSDAVGRANDRLARTNGQLVATSDQLGRNLRETGEVLEGTRVLTSSFTNVTASVELDFPLDDPSLGPWGDWVRNILRRANDRIEEQIDASGRSRLRIGPLTAGSPPEPRPSKLVDVVLLAVPRGKPWNSKPDYQIAIAIDKSAFIDCNREKCSIRAGIVAPHNPVTVVGDPLRSIADLKDHEIALEVYSLNEVLSRTSRIIVEFYGSGSPYEICSTRMQRWRPGQPAFTASLGDAAQTIDYFRPSEVCAISTRL